MLFLRFFVLNIYIKQQLIKYNYLFFYNFLFFKFNINFTYLNTLLNRAISVILLIFFWEYSFYYYKKKYYFSLFNLERVLWFFLYILNSSMRVTTNFYSQGCSNCISVYDFSYTELYPYFLQKYFVFAKLKNLEVVFRLFFK